MSAALPVDYCEVCRMYCIVLSGCLPCCQWTIVRCVGCIVLYCIVRMSAALPVDYCEVCRMYCIGRMSATLHVDYCEVCMMYCIVLYWQDVCHTACGLL